MKIIVISQNILYGIYIYIQNDLLSPVTLNYDATFYNIKPFYETFYLIFWLFCFITLEFAKRINLSVD